MGSLINYAVALLLLRLVPDLAPQVASLAGIATGTIVNFVALKFVVFKQRHYRARIRWF